MLRFIVDEYSNNLLLMNIIRFKEILLSHRYKRN